VVRRELIEDLPLNGRNALDLATLLPGAVNQSGARVSLSQENGVSVNGARGSDNNVLLDGGANVDIYNGTPNSLPNPDALQSSVPPARSARSMGARRARSSAVTKGGGNSSITARFTNTEKRRDGRAVVLCRQRSYHRRP
jgi:hypothetical protein